VPTAFTAEGSPPVLLGQLTRQERVVLRYLPSSMTYEEIAADLYLSPNTVKSHVYSVFRKLASTGTGPRCGARASTGSCDRRIAGAGREAKIIWSG
jgi:DNA-binding CsgD family transcriptional regulator